IPRLILEKNLYGFDIDDRAAQLSGFALMMRGRADDRRLLSADEPIALNVISIQESKGLSAEQIAKALLPSESRFALVPNTDLLPDTVAHPPLAISETLDVARGEIASMVLYFAEA